MRLRRDLHREPELGLELPRTQEKVLAARPLAGAEFAGSVVLMFQPGEEGHSGARHMIEEGALEAAGERPVAAYAIHVNSAGHHPGRGTARHHPALLLARHTGTRRRGRT